MLDWTRGPCGTFVAQSNKFSFVCLPADMTGWKIAAAPRDWPVVDYIGLGPFDNLAEAKANCEKMVDANH